MLDLKATKKVTIGENVYEIGKVPMRVYGLTQTGLVNASTSLDVETAVVNTAYDFIPYYLVTATVGKDKMPAPVTVPEWGGVMVRKCDDQWVSEMIPAEDAAQILMDGQEFNTVQVKDSKN